MRLRRYQPDDESVDDLDAVIVRHKKPRKSGVFYYAFISNEYERYQRDPSAALRVTGSVGQNEIPRRFALSG